MMGDRFKRLAPFAVVALLLVSSVGGVVTLATAQSSAWEHSEEGSPNTVVVDVSNMTGDVKVTVSTPARESTISKTTLYRETRNVAETKYLLFGNQGAYETVNVTVSHDGTAASGEPSFGDESIISYADKFDAMLSEGQDLKSLATTGGDANLQCGQIEKFQGLFGEQRIVECRGLPGTTTVDESLDKQEVKLEMYQSLQNTRAQSQIFTDTVDNYLEDTKGAALSEANRAYVNALNNGASKSAAKTAAKGAVADYYAQKQYQLIEKWELTAEQYQYLERVRSNESVSNDFIRILAHPEKSTGTYSGSEAHYWVTGSTTLGTETVTLTNGSTAEATTWEFASGTVYTYSGESSSTADNTAIGPLSIADTNWPSQQWHTDAYVVPYGLQIGAPESLEDPVNFTAFELKTYYSRLDQQKTDVNAQVDTMVEGTYDQYQQGDINLSEVATAQTLSREFGPETKDDSYQTYALARLARLGVSPPGNLSEQQNMTVRVGGPDGTVYEDATLAADNNPASGTWEVGTTYNTGDIPGAEFVIMDGRTESIPNGTQVTITSAYNQTGGQISTVSYPDVSYTATNLDELQGIYETNARLRAEIAAQEQNNLGTGGGGGLLGGGNSSIVLVLVAAAFIAVLVGNGGRR